MTSLALGARLRLPPDHLENAYLIKDKITGISCIPHPPEIYEFFSSLDISTTTTELLSDFRPISNLKVILKVIKKVIPVRLQADIDSN